MTTRGLVFAGVAKPRVDSAEVLRTDLMREHAAVAETVRDVNLTFVPRFVPVNMGDSRLSAKSWDFIIALGGGTIYLPGLTKSDAGDQIKIGIKTGAATLVADDGATLNGNASVSAPTVCLLEWDGTEWWRLA